MDGCRGSPFFRGLLRISKIMDTPRMDVWWGTMARSDLAESSQALLPHKSSAAISHHPPSLPPCTSYPRNLHIHPQRYVTFLSCARSPPLLLLQRSCTPCQVS